MGLRTHGWSPVLEVRALPVAPACPLAGVDSACLGLWLCPSWLALTQVDGRRFLGSEEGLLVVVIDGKRARVLGQAVFRKAVLQGAPWQLYSYVAALPDK